MTEHTAIPVDILDDLSSRFIINVPEEEQTDPIRLFFQIELAHWFYLDFYRADNASLKSCGMKEFTKHLLKRIPTLSFVLNDLDSHYGRWKEYKMSVPTFGAIILNQDLTKVLLVQSYFEKASWGFPKGKVNEEEDPVKCAVREVLEETGLDISKHIRGDQFIEALVCEQTIRLYIIHGIEETEKFHPLTRHEIKCVEWFTINDLPTNKKDITPKIKMGVRPNSFFMILPFMRRIKGWIQEARGETTPQSVPKRRTRHKSVGDLTPSPSSNGLAKNKKTANDMEMDFQSLRLSAQNMLPTRNAKNQRDMKSSKVFYRRQLFDNLNDNSSKNQVNNSGKCSVKQHFEDLEIVIPRWLNFKLDRISLIKYFEP